MAKGWLLFEDLIMSVLGGHHCC